MRLFHASPHQFRVGDMVLSPHARGQRPKDVDPLPDPYRVYLSDVPVHPTVMHQAVCPLLDWSVYEVIPIGRVDQGAYHDWLAPAAVVIANHGPAWKWVQLPPSPDSWDASDRLFWSDIAQSYDKVASDIWMLYYDDLRHTWYSKHGDKNLGALMDYLRSCPYPPPAKPLLSKPQRQRWMSLYFIANQLTA
jgi:hypothetical protein